MSIQAMSRVLANSQSEGLTRLVFLVMANRAGGDHDVCFASVDRLRRECRVGERTVQRSMRWLVDHGEVEFVGIHPHYRTNQYQILLEEGVSESHPPVTDEPLVTPKQKKQSLGVVVVPTDLGSSSSSKNAARSKKDPNPNQPTHDQLYLVEKLVGAWNAPQLTPAAIVKLNKAHGRAAVESAMREVHGFPPEEAIASLYAYIASVAEAKAAS